MNKYTLPVILLLFLFQSPLSAQELKLWYDRPATIWEEALPLGNSRLGAMIYGIPQREEIQLNEETIWGGSPHRNDNPKALHALPEVRELISQGKNEEADKLINETFFGGPHGMPYQTAGSLILYFPGHSDYQDYYRELNIDSAITTTSYRVDGVGYTRQTFTSFADDVVIMRITADKKGTLNFTAGYSHPSGTHTFAETHTLVLEGKTTDHEGIPGNVLYQIRTLVNNKDGEVTVSPDKISVSNATEATIYISIATNFTDYKTLQADYADKSARLLRVAAEKEYHAAVKEHTTLYNQQFSRFKINLGNAGNSKSLTTTQQIANFHREQDPALVALLCQYGRYLLICSSQPGGQPANLQGIWCNHLYPAWDSKYTLNINAEMNYWPAEITNLSETHEPFFRMIRELSQTGCETAETMYGAQGWVVHHNTDIWRITGPVDFAAAGMWPTGGAWLCQHLWEHYLYTGDRDFLAAYYPVMKSAADFFLTSLTDHPQYDWKVVSPSVSPEHGPVTAGCTMDNQLVFDLFTRTAQAAQILRKDDAYRNQLIETAYKLPPMQIGKYGQLQEWLEDVDDPQNEHRHVSHLYGLYPGNQISPYITPELFQAARQSLIYRGDMATGWSIGWKINLWARLQDGNRAYKIIQNMLTLAGNEEGNDGRTYPNLFTAHPPFQIDGNFGLTAGVAEMLLQSHDGAVHLLPALPQAWSTGTVSGIKARGGFEVSMSWNDSCLEEATVLSELGGNIRLRSYIPLKGAGLKKAEGENENPFFINPSLIVPLQTNQTHTIQPVLQKVYEYDLMTEAGKRYKIVTDIN